MLLTLFLIYLILLLVVRRKRPAWTPDALMPGLFALLTAGFFWRVISGDVYLPADGGDLGSFLYPTYRFIQQSLHAGAWPLWNPHLYSGVPFSAEVQSGIFYPPHLARFLLGGEITYRDMEWLVMGHIWWAGVTLYALARGLRFNRYGAVMAGVAFMFSDLFIIHFGNLNLIAVAAWLPLTLLGGYRYLQGDGWEWALGAGLALGVGSLAGHIQMTLYGLIALGLWAGFWLLTDLSHWRRNWLRALLAMLIPTAVAVGVMAPMLLPGLEIAHFTIRSDWKYSATVGYSLSPAQFIGLLIPNYFGRSPMLHWGMWPRVETGYIGVFTLILALAGVILRRDRLTWLLLAAGAVAFAFSMGIYSVVHGWFTWALPGLDQLRAPARFIFVFDISVALLAGRGVQALMEDWDEEASRLLRGFWRALLAMSLLLSTVIPAIVYATLMISQNMDGTLHLRVSIAAIAVMHFLIFFLSGVFLFYLRKQRWISGRSFALAAIALVFWNLATLGASNDISEKDPTASFNHPAILDFLKADDEQYRIDARTDINALWQPDTALLHGLDDVWGVANPLTLAHYVRYWNSMDSRSTDKYALLNVKYVLGQKDVALDWDVWELAFDGDPDLNVYENRHFQPRVHLLGQTRIVPNQEAAFAALRDPAFQPLSEVILEAGQPLKGPGGTAEVSAWKMNYVRVRTDSDDESVLLVAQTWYPGWQARVDDGPWQPVLRADGAFQAVLTPAGDHTIELRFRAPRQTWGLILSILTTFVALWGIFWRWSRRRDDA